MAHVILKRINKTELICMRVTLEVNVLESNIEKFKKQLTKFKKMYDVQKLPFSAKLVTSLFVEVPINNGKEKGGFINVKAYKYAISYETLEIDSKYSVVGVLERNIDKTVFSLVDKNLVKTIPKEFMYSELTCDHCAKKRKRKQVFLVYDKNQKQIIRLGKSCLQAYVPGSMDRIITLYRFSEEFLATDWYSFGGGDNIDTYFKFKDFVIKAIVDIQENGYKSRGRAFGDEKTTKDSVLKRIQLEVGLKPKYTDTEELLFKQFTEEITKKPSVFPADAQQNLISFSQEGFVKDRFLERLCFFIFLFTKNLELKTRQNEKDSNKTNIKENKTNYIGEVGERIELPNLKFSRTITFDNMYSYNGGLSYIHQFRDKDENLIVYLGSLDIFSLLKLNYSDYEKYARVKEQEGFEFEEDDYIRLYTLNLSAIIKKHQEYKGEKQTVIKNVKVLKIEGV